MTLSDPVLLAVLGGIGTGFLMLIRWLKEDRDFWRDTAVRLMDAKDLLAEMDKRPGNLSPKAANAAQRIVRRTRDG